VAEATLQSVRSVGVELNRGGRDESRFCGNDMLGQVMAQASTRTKATNKAPSVVSSQLVTLRRSIVSGAAMTGVSLMRRVAMIKPPGWRRSARAKPRAAVRRASARASH